MSPAAPVRPLRSAWLRSAAALLAAAALLPALLPAQQPPSFVNEIVPLLTRSGCNTGSCHGAASGKNGFSLSLFGYDPAHDFRALTRELRGRRLDPSDPEHSLMLQKATAQVGHQGGKRFARDDPRFATLRRWIAAGAPDDAATAPKLTGIALEPATAECILADAGLPLRLTAHYQDGSARDVAAMALWSSNNEAAVAVAGDGRALLHGAGDAVVLARYGGFAAVCELTVHRDDAPFAWPDPPAANFVDQLLHERLRRARVLPAPLCSDAVFVRRVHLDLLSLLPPPDVARAFVADPSPDKRARLIDQLLERPEFAAVQAMAWAEVLQVDAATMEPKGAALLARWLQQAFLQQRPFDAVVRELLTADGPTFAEPAANFALAAREPNLLAEHTAQVFLGIRMQCAQCHNHPFENWTMDDYYGFAAYFGQLGRKRGEDPTEWIVYDRQNGEVRHKLDDRVMAPKPLGAEPLPIPRGSDRRAVLAAWLTAKDNPWFARNLANRAFARLFGRGIVEPVDDVRISNPPSHEALLARLAQLLVDSGFDFRPLYRALCNSRSYQQARHPDAPPPQLFAGNQVRRLSAEALLDAIAAVTGVDNRYPGLPAGSPASLLVSGRTDVRFLELFGRPARTSSCTCERSTEPTLGQTLHLIHGDTIEQKLQDRGSRLAVALRQQQPPDAMLDELFLAAYSRPPRPDEAQRLLAAVRAAKDAKAITAAWQDVYWAVLNSQEFQFQH